MTQTEELLPSFQAPPVDEVAIAVQFQELPKFSLAFGLFYDMVRGELPHFEEHEPIAVQFETFGGLREVRATFALDGLMGKRGWYISEDGHRLTQLQSNRLVRNWRRRSGVGEYPRFPVVLSEFWESFGVLEKVVEQIGLAPPRLNQAEVTYFNAIPLRDGETFAQACARVFAWPHLDRLRLDARGSRLEAEGSNVALSLLVSPPGAGSPIARLAVNAAPAQSESGEQVVYLTLRFRGPPPSADRDSIEEFLLTGRSAIVKTFTELTSESCHQDWLRET